MPKKKTIEQQVADTILQRNIATIRIAGKEYNIAPPSIATLILISEIISTLPIVNAILTTDKTERNRKVFQTVLNNARFFKPLGDIAAVLILGAKGLTEETEVITTRRYFFGLFRRKRKEIRIVDRRAELADMILDNYSPSQLSDLLVTRLNTLELGSFFSITTSLCEANVLKPTREVEQ